MLKRLAVGGMAELFLARDSRTDALVVIKRILPYLSTEAEFVQMFLDEARIAAQLDHPNVVQVHELGKLEESIFIAMEFVDGVDLRKILQEELNAGAVIPPPIAAWIVARTCDGLYYAHNRAGLDGVPLELIHRDVSPQNVMVGYDGKVKLVDFGIAKANSYMERSKPGVIKGKFLYLSPEQLSQERLDHRADLFAVGTMLYEITTGKSPFYKATTEAVILAIRGEEPPPPHLVSRDYPMELSRIVMRCLTKDRSRRYQQANEIARDLDAWLRTQPVPVDATRAAAYVAEVFGDEGERTVVHLPKPVQPAFDPPTQRPEFASRSGAPLRRDSESTNPLAPPVGRRITSESAPAAGAQFADDDPRTQMASTKEMAEAFRRPTGVTELPQRRPSGQSYPQAGASFGDDEAEATRTVTAGSLSGPTPSMTPSMTPSNDPFVQDGPVFDMVQPGAMDAPSTKIEGSRAERIRASKSQPMRRPTLDEDDLSVTGSEVTPYGDDDDFSTVSGGQPLKRLPPSKIILGAIVGAVLLILVAAVVKAFDGDDEAPAAPQPRPLSLDHPGEETGTRPAEPGDEAVAVKDDTAPVAHDAEKPDAGSAVLAAAVKPERDDASDTASAVALLTAPLEPQAAAPAPKKVPVIFKAPRGTSLYAGRTRFIPSKTYRLTPGKVRVKYRCPGRRGARGTKSFTVAANHRRTQAFVVSCRRR